MSRASVLAQNDQEVQDFVLAFKQRPYGPLAPQFSNDDALASTAYVRQAAGSLAGYAIYNASAVLTAADIGKYVYADAPTINLTLPDATLLPAGSKLYIQASAISKLTVISVNGNVSGPNGNGQGSPNVVLGPGVATEFISWGAGWLAVGGSGLVSLSANGYEKLPSGLIRQWGTVATTASGTVVTFPIVFPNAVFSLIGSPSNNDAGGNGVFSIFSRSGLTNSGFTAWTKASSTAKVSDTVQWLACGY